MREGWGEGEEGKNEVYLPSIAQKKSRVKEDMYASRGAEYQDERRRDFSSRHGALLREGGRKIAIARY